MKKAMALSHMVIRGNPESNLKVFCVQLIAFFVFLIIKQSELVIKIK